MRKVLVVVIAVMALGATSAQAAQVQMCNVAIPMSDGVTLRANIDLPAPGARVPTILTVTGYNKDVANPTGTNCAPGQGISGSDPNMVSAGYAVMTVDDRYAVMTVDDRGTGASGGVWDSWGARTQQDYKEVLDWIQRQPWSDSKVGMYGGSYMGITSLLVAEADAARVAAARRRAVDAVWADVPMADAYRDVTFHGGAVDSGFIPLWLGLTTALSDIPPSTTLTDPAGSAVDLRPAPGERLQLRRPEDPRHDDRRRLGLRRAVLPAALARRADRVAEDPGRVDRRLVGHLPARRAPAV